MDRTIIYNASVSKVDKPKGPRPSEAAEQIKSYEQRFELLLDGLKSFGLSEKEIEEMLDREKIREGKKVG